MPLHPDNITRIRKNYAAIVNSISLYNFIFKLYSEFCLTEDNIDQITAAVNTKDQNRIILDCLMTGPANGYDIFIESLKEINGFEELADLIEKTDLKDQKDESDLVITMPLNPDNVKRIRKNYAAIVREIGYSLLKDCMDRLYSEYCLTKNDKDQINGARTYLDKTRIFLDSLMTGPAIGYALFIELLQNDRCDLAKQIENTALTDQQEESNMEMTMPCNPDNAKRIRTYYAAIVETISSFVLKSCIDKLYSECCLTRDDKEQINAARTSRNMIRMFLDRLMTGPAKGYALFIELLKESLTYNELAEQIEMTDPRDQNEETNVIIKKFMNQDHVKKIRKHYAAIVKEIPENAIDLFIDELISQRYLTLDERQEIDVETGIEKNRILLDRLMTLPAKAYALFINILKNETFNFAEQIEKTDLRDEEDSEDIGEILKMKTIYKVKIKKHFEAIVEAIPTSDLMDFIDRLYGEYCLSADDKEEIRAATTSVEKNRMFLDRLMTGPAKGYNMFIELLKEMSYDDLAEKIQKTEVKEDDIEPEDVIFPGIVNDLELKSFISQGSYESYGNKIYLAGACSVGKSTLASILIGDDIPLNWNSTDGLKIFFGRNGIHLQERKMVPLVKGNQNILSNVLRGQPQMDQIQPNMGQKQQDIQNIPSTEGYFISKSAYSGTSKQQAICTSTGTGSSQSGPMLVERAQSLSSVHEKQEVKAEKLNAEEKKKSMQNRLGYTLIHEGMKQEIKKGEYKVKIAPSDLVDFGGQKSYDMTHQLFIQGKGTFTLMFNGRKRLNDPLPEYLQGNVTSKSILKHWVDSILTYCGEDDDDILPIILFVATHRDTLKEDEQSKMMTEFKQGLKEMFQNHERQKRIKYDDIFFIKGTDKYDPEVLRLQTTYVEIAFKQKSWGKRMPIAWVPLELQIMEMRSNNINIISKEDLEKINDENDDLALTSKQLDDFLRRQHLLGNIMYFEIQGLEKYIVVQPNSLIHILRSFITDEMFFPSDTTLRNILNEMTMTGKIKKKDLFQLWKQPEFNRHMPDDNVKQFVVNVLIHLDLLVEQKRYDSGENVGDVYLVPCIIKQEPPTNFCENLEESKTVYMSYKFLKSSIPAALSYKIIGAALNVWPLKETDAKVTCLYNKGAILCIDQSNELHILVKDNRVVVCLLNEHLRHFISPDIASCVQECLTLTIKNALEFYHNCFGKSASSFEIENMFTIEVGEKCKVGICYLPLLDAKQMPSWKCPTGKNHETRYPLYWTFDRPQLHEQCPVNCPGLDKECLEECPEDKHLARIALHIGIDKFRDFVIKLGLKDDDWKVIESTYDKLNASMMRIDALCKWKATVDNPSLQDLHDAITYIDYSSHILCQIFREERKLLESKHIALNTKLDYSTLDKLSKNIGNCALHLGVELGLRTVEIEETIYKYNKDMFKQNCDILNKWSKSESNKTLRNLMRVLQTVDPRGTKFLDAEFKIGLYKKK